MQSIVIYVRGNSRPEQLFFVFLNSGSICKGCSVPKYGENASLLFLF